MLCSSMLCTLRCRSDLAEVDSEPQDGDGSDPAYV